MLNASACVTLFRHQNNVHDEVVIECECNKLEDVIQIMSTNPTWAAELPLDADGWVGDCFKKD